MKGLFITGTDTDAGKTTVTAALLRALKVAGVPADGVRYAGGRGRESGGGGNLSEERLPSSPRTPHHPPKTFDWWGGRAP